MIDDTIAAQLAIHSRSISTLFLPLIDFMSQQFVFWKNAQSSIRDVSLYQKNWDIFFESQAM